MNEQEAQKVSFKKWGDFNKNSLSIDHKNGHEQGLDAALKWAKQGQEPFPRCAVYTDKYGEKQLVTGMDKGQEDRFGQRLYLHPTPQPDVAELVRSFEKLIDAACECQDWQCFPARALEEAQDALAKWEAKK